MGTETGPPTPPPASERVRAELRDRGLVHLRVDGDCMSPTLRRGDHVWVVRATDLRPGDVALLDCSGWLEIHRLLEIIQVGPHRWYVHLGDASPVCGVAGPADILGVVRSAGRRRPAPAIRARLRALALRAAALLHFIGGRGRPSPRKET